MFVVGFSIIRIEKRAYANYSEMFMQLIEPDIDWLCRKYTIRGLEPDDLAQELRLQVWRKIHLYNPKKGNFRGWAVRIMNNRVIELHRKTIKKNVDMLDHKIRALDFDVHGEEYVNHDE